MIKRFNECEFDDTKTFENAKKLYKQGKTFIQIKDELNGIKEEELDTETIE